MEWNRMEWYGMESNRMEFELSNRLWNGLNGIEWNHHRLNGIESNGMESNGIERMEWNGMEWNGMESNGLNEWNGIDRMNGMEWNGMEWNGMNQNGMNGME